MAVRITKRCAKCASTFKSATCPKDCPTKFMRWQVSDDRTVSGKRQRRSIGTFTSSKEAEYARTEAEDNVRRGKAVVSSSMPLSEWIEMWEESRGRDFSPTSLSTLHAGFNKWLLPALGDLQLRDLTPIDFDRLYAKMVDVVKPITVQGYARGWHSVLNDAVRKGFLVRNPMDGSNVPKAVKVEPDLLETTDVMNVLELLKGHRYGIVFRLLIITGARRGEILGLTWDDVTLDGDAPTLRIRRALTGSNIGTRVGEPKTESSKRTVALDPETVRQLRDLRQEHREEAMRVGPAKWQEAGIVLDKHGEPQSLDLVCRSDDGTFVVPSRMTYHWKMFLSRAGLDHVKLHSLRHAWATVAIENGVSLKVVQVQLGHTTISTTADVYSHVRAEAQAEATATVMGAFGS